jgi:hypothetical protein
MGKTKETCEVKSKEGCDRMRTLHGGNFEMFEKDGWEEG